MATTTTTPQTFTRNEVIDPAQLRGPAPRLTVLSRSWFRLVFPPHADPTPEWSRYADVLMKEERGVGSWVADPRTPLWRHAEIQEYARMLVDVHNDVLSTRTTEALASPEALAPEVAVEVEAEVTGFRLILLTPHPAEPHPADDVSEGPAWLAPARATLFPPDSFELDIPDTTPQWLVAKYRKAVDTIYSQLGFTILEADSVIRAFAPGSTLTARLTESFGVPDGYRRLVCSRLRNEGPRRGPALLPRLTRLRTGFYRLDFPLSHEVSALTFDLVNKTGSLSPEDPSAEALEYLETYLLAMRTVFGDDDGEGEYAALAGLTRGLSLNDPVAKNQNHAGQNHDATIDPEKSDRILTSPHHVLVGSPVALSPLALTPVLSHELDEVEVETPRKSTVEAEQGMTVLELLAEQQKDTMAADPAPEAYPVDIDEVYAEYRARVLDIYKRSPPRQDQLEVLQERHFEFLRTSLAIDRPLTGAEGEELLDNVESRIEGMLPPLLRRWYALMQLNLPVWGQDLPRLSEHLAQTSEDLQREELIGAEFEFDDEETCPICTDVIQPQDALAITPCYHLMHRDCLEDWFDSGPDTESCPVCRRDFVVYESLLAITKRPYFEIAWKTWMGQLDDGESRLGDEFVTDEEGYTHDEGSELDVGSEYVEVGSKRGD